jgi:hypothetical protein
MMKKMEGKGKEKTLRNGGKEEGRTKSANCDILGELTGMKKHSKLCCGR